MHIKPLGDSALIIQLGDAIDAATHEEVQRVLHAIDQGGIPALVEAVPAYTTVTVYYDPLAAMLAGASPSGVTRWMEEKVIERIRRSGSGRLPKPRTIEIPVCYGEEFAPDLREVAAARRLSADEVIRRHATPLYTIYFLGFAPGFPYMGAVPSELAMPRRPQPRSRIEPGSVGITGRQCCIYPISTPAGWNIIGRTPVPLYLPDSDPPALLRAGDQVRFRPMTREEFAAWRPA